MKKIIFASAAILMGMTASANAGILGGVLGNGGSGANDVIPKPAGIYVSGDSGRTANLMYSGNINATVSVNNNLKVLEIPLGGAGDPEEFYGAITVGNTAQQINFFSQNTKASLLEVGVDLDPYAYKVTLPEELSLTNVGSFSNPSYKDMIVDDEEAEIEN